MIIQDFPRDWQNLFTINFIHEMNQPYLYQKKNRYFAQCGNDIMDLAGIELSSLGAENISPSYRGMYFSATLVNVYRINYRSRLVSRILAPLIEFPCYSDKELYDNAISRVDWSTFLTPDMTFAIYSQVIHSRIRHSRFATQRLKDAIVDQFKGRMGNRPSVEKFSPNLWFNLHIQNNRATISLDTSGGSLHRRGYRPVGHKAPMKETLAAAIMDLSGWTGEVPLVDPFCGTGTILCEAYLKLTGIPPGFLRKSFGFEQLPEFNSRMWEKTRKAELSKIDLPEKNLIHGSDISGQSVKLAQMSLNHLNRNHGITLRQVDAFDIDSIENSLIVCNPPYGLRLTGENLPEFYRRFGDFLKNRCKGSTAYIYFGNREYIKNIGLKTSMKRPLANGKLDGRLARFELY